MAGSVQAPYGMVQVGILGDAYNTSGQTMYPLGSNNTNAIFAGQPVHFAAGVTLLLQLRRQLRSRLRTLPSVSLRGFVM